MKVNLTKNNKQGKVSKKSKSGQKRKTRESESAKGKEEGESANREVWSKSKKKRMRRAKGKLNRTQDKQEQQQEESGNRNTTTAVNTRDHDDNKKNAGSSSSEMQKSFMARLTGSRFRILNEELYTSPSQTSFEKFSSNPELFQQYHEGFRHQVQQWPENPINTILRWIIKRFGSEGKKRDGPVVVADFGCGDAELAKLLSARGGKFVTHSFDLVAASDLVTACDMANVPLEENCVDVAIFCLALMGTNVADFLREAHRVLKRNGKVKIAEVRSRFESAKGKDGLDGFVSFLDQIGFKCLNLDRSNKMFVTFELEKNGKSPNSNAEFSIKPCIYRKR